MKRDIIDILTSMSHENARVQDTIRENGGLQLILSQASIDDDNPCMLMLYWLTLDIRERAWLCIRTLMENNTDNQQMMRAFQTAAPSALNR